MCIQAPGEIFNPHCLYCFKHLTVDQKTMSFQKKNVILGFRKDEYVPTADQLLVKYSAGKGNNLHEVECLDGSTILVSMPKKYRHTVWLKKEDCLVIDPIEEGKKVRGEIVCVLPFDTVRDLIVSRQWPNPSDGVEVDTLLQFFTSSSERKPNREEFDAFPSSDSSDMESDEDGEEEGDEDEAAEDEEEGNNEDDPEEENSESQSKATEGDNDNDTENSQSTSIPPNNADDPTRDRNRSRVQLVTSGIVTVTNVLTEGMENEMQSLEFGADEEESSDELTGDARDLQRHANTIRIQVNYNNQQN